jgi:radical SAM protein with 4Fe4S-binding SPASM domain
MKYYLNKNVYWVRGAQNSCLYDFNQSKLYWLNRDTTLFLQEVLNAKELLTGEAALTLSQFQEVALIAEDEQNASTEDIESILVANEKIEFCWIELTDKCNLKCVHCYNSSDMSCKHSLTLGELKHLVDELVAFGIKTVQLIGGEPLLIKNTVFFEMIDYVSTHFESFEIFCNGTLLDEVVVKNIAKYSNAKVAVSLYSFIASEHDKITGIAGSQKKTLNAIDLLKQHNIPVRYVGIYVDRLKVGQHKEYGKNYKQDYIRLTGRANLNLYNPTLLREKLITLDKFTSKCTKERVLDLHKTKCFSKFLYISSNFDVFPCVMERRVKHGNLRNERLPTIIQKKLLHHSKNDVEGCKDCEFRHLCKDCRPDSLSGIFNDKPWYCTYEVYNGKCINSDEYIKSIFNPLKTLI